MDASSNAGDIPYVGALLGRGLAVIVALGDGGLNVTAVMLVLAVTALGGPAGEIIGPVLAVPFTVIAAYGISRFRS